MNAETIPPKFRSFLDLVACPVCLEAEACWPGKEMCDDCFDKTPAGIEQAAQRAAAHTEVAEQEKAERLAIALQKISRTVSPEILGTDITHPGFNLRDLERAMSVLERHDSDWLWLHSKHSGRCKSRIAFLLLQKRYAAELAKNTSWRNFRGRFPSVLWVDGDRLVDAFRIRKQWSLGAVAAKAQEFSDDAREADFLVIDDFTKRRMNSEDASDGIWEILKHRHEHQLWTVVTDNVDIESFAPLLHPKHADFIARRLAERCFAIDCDAAPAEE